MNYGQGLFYIGCILVIGVFALLCVQGIDDREIHPSHYKEVLELENDRTASLLRGFMEDGKITVSELNALRKKHTDTSGARAQLRERYGE